MGGACQTCRHRYSSGQEFGIWNLEFGIWNFPSPIIDHIHHRTGHNGRGFRS